MVDAVDNGDYSLVPKPEAKKGMSRRTFLRTALTATGVVAATALTAPPIVDWIIERNKEADEHLFDNGLEDFIPFYHAVTDLEKTHRVYPTIWFEHNSYFDLRSLVENGAREKLRPILLERVRDGWGEKLSSCSSDAEQKVKMTNIKVNEGVSADIRMFNMSMDHMLLLCLPLL